MSEKSLDQRREEFKAQLDRDKTMGETEPVQEAAKALCRARCALFDRDPNCQETGRCGTNWQMYRHKVIATITKPVYS